ncbi:MAG: ATP-binding cassette domain-containing protein [Phycisphaeraceae bacterium]|nr:MAG: ATP-binding cassette domain-containing protein [Phycisphaeraceae bacterium]
MSNVRKTFGKKVAVEGIDLDIPMGSLVGFIGPNGAGKTTTIRMIMAILFPDSGELTVLGRKSAVESKDRIGYLPEERGVYKKMKVGAFLRHTGRLKGLPPRGLNDRISHWLKKVELPDVWSKKCEELSKGMQQKVQFISAVLHEPDLVILDEPFSGLDPVNMRLLRDLIDELHDNGTTVIFSTHVMSQAQQICDHIVMIHNGRKMLDDPLRDIRARSAPKAVWFEPLPDSFDPAVVEALAPIESVRFAEGHYEATLRGGVDPADVVGAVAAAAPMARVELHRPTLEDIFIDIVKGTGEAADEDLRAALRLGHAAINAEEVAR